MSAPLKLDSEQLHALATALEQLTELSEQTGVDFSSSGMLSASIAGSDLQVKRLDDGRYVVDDVNGY